MIWILLRSPKMKGAILGFQKRVWCPKWTPASSICRMDTLVINTPDWVEPPRVPVGNSAGSPGGTRRTPTDRDDTRAGLLKIAALYTMNISCTQRLPPYDRE